MMPLTNLPEFPCTCSECVRCCTVRPGWPTVEECKLLIENGLSSKLMLEWFESDTMEEILVLVPAVVGHEGKKAPYWPSGNCTFLSSDSKCLINSVKPTDCKVSGCQLQEDSLDYQKFRHETIPSSWNTKEGRELVDSWSKSNLGEK